MRHDEYKKARRAVPGRNHVTLGGFFLQQLLVLTNFQDEERASQDAGFFVCTNCGHVRTHTHSPIAKEELIRG